MQTFSVIKKLYVAVQIRLYIFYRSIFSPKCQLFFKRSKKAFYARIVIATEDFSFIDNTYKAVNSENIIRDSASNILSCFSVEHFRKVFSYQYKTAFERSKTSNQEFTFDEIMNGCNLSKEETQTALYLMKATNINSVYFDRETKTEKYVFLISNALYAHAIFKLAELLSEDACWTVVRDTSMISDYAFEK